MTKLIGLTGRSGAGKSAAAEILLELGYPVINADAVYHALIAQSSPCTEELLESFGKEIAGENGGIDRKKLAMRVFGHENTPKLLHTLNEITHKYIMADIRNLVQDYRERSVPAVILDAPQLFEAGADRECDAILGIIASDAVCIERITKRDGISSEAAARRLEAQHPSDYFRKF